MANDASWANRLAADRKVFMETLTHDDHNSLYVIATGPRGKWRQRAYKLEGLLEARLPRNQNVYMTRNGFTIWRRKTEFCRQVNAMMFDLDCHVDNHEERTEELFCAFEDAVAAGELPVPTMLVNTGRGIQIYYVLKKSISYMSKDGKRNEKLLAYFKDVEAGLVEALKQVVAGVKDAKFDPSVLDYARVGRVPGTFNPKANAWCTLLYHTNRFYELKELKTYGRIEPAKTSWKNIKQFVAAEKRTHSVLLSRLHGVERLQKHRKYSCIGSRENMCFVFYNTATQLYGPAFAHAATMAFNSKFTSPLPASDIDSIARTVDKNVVLYGEHAGERGFYPLKAERVVEKLFMTQDEMAATKFFGSKRQRDRRAAKEATAAKKEARNEKIIHEFKMGATQQQVADKVGCSKRTVANVLSDAGVSRGDRYTLEEKFSQVASLKRENANSCHASWCVSFDRGAGDGLVGTLWDGVVEAREILRT